MPLKQPIRATGPADGEEESYHRIKEGLKMLREEIRPSYQSYQRRRHATDRGTIEERRMHEIDPEDAQNMFRCKKEKQIDVGLAEKSTDVKENSMQKKPSSMAEEGGKGSNNNHNLPKHAKKAAGMKNHARHPYVLNGSKIKIQGFQDFSALYLSQRHFQPRGLGESKNM